MARVSLAARPPARSAVAAAVAAAATITTIATPTPAAAATTTRTASAAVAHPAEPRHMHAPGPPEGPPEALASAGARRARTYASRFVLGRADVSMPAATASRHVRHGATTRVRSSRALTLSTSRSRPRTSLGTRHSKSRGRRPAIAWFTPGIGRSPRRAKGERAPLGSADRTQSTSGCVWGKQNAEVFARQDRTSNHPQQRRLQCKARPAHARHRIQRIHHENPKKEADNRD